jgi:hypothetical protein
LEEALTNYGVAEPRPGLETRILANLESCAVRRQRRWTFTFAAVAAVLFVALMVDLRYPKNRSASDAASGAQPSGPQRVVPDTGNKVTSQSPQLDVQIVRAHHPNVALNSPHDGTTQRQSVPDVNPSDAKPDGSDLAEQEPPASGMDQSDAEAPASEVVAQEEATARAGPSRPAASPAEQRSVPEIRISGLNINPIQIKEITSGKTTD